MGRVERDREIARRRVRRAKLKKLRVKFEAATTQAQRDEIQQRAMKTSPFVVLEAAK